MIAGSVANNLGLKARQLHLIPVGNCADCWFVGFWLQAATIKTWRYAGKPKSMTYEVKIEHKLLIVRNQCVTSVKTKDQASLVLLIMLTHYSTSKLWHRSDLKQESQAV